MTASLTADLEIFFLKPQKYKLTLARNAISFFEEIGSRHQIFSVSAKVSSETNVQAAPPQDIQDAPLHLELGGEHHRRHPLPRHGRRPHRWLCVQLLHRGGAAAGDDVQYIVIIPLDDGDIQNCCTSWWLWWPPCRRPTTTTGTPSYCSRESSHSSLLASSSLALGRCSTWS